MRVTVNTRRTCSIVVGAMLVGSALSRPAAAESAYVAQVTAGIVTAAQTIGMRGSVSTNQTTPTARNAGFVPTPEAASAALGGRNVAQTLQIGSYNQVAQVQTGAGSHSAVGILGGNLNNVGVLQAGNNLHSNLVLLGTQGLNVGVLQPNGSTPVNMLIARLPNGGLLIKR